MNRYLHTRLSGTILFKLRELRIAIYNVYRQPFTRNNNALVICSRMDGDIIAELQTTAVDGLFASVSGILAWIGAVTTMFY